MAQVSDPWPLASRADDAARVRAAVEDPAATACLLYGTAGVGKSRLAEECRSAAAADGYPTARVLASVAAASLPLGALAPLLPIDVGPTTTPTELFERARAALADRADGGRLVLVVDDAHLLDTSSAVLLTQLLGAGAVFVLATIRTGEAAPDAVATWWRAEGAVRIDLTDLDRDATDEVLGAALGGVVGGDTARRFHQASGGNPLLLRELVLQAFDAGHLTDESGTWRLTGDIPPSRRLVDVLATRLGALDEPARRILEMLAVCAPLGPAELSGDVAPEALEALERTGLIQVIVDGHRHHLALAHPLYGEAIRADLTVLRRRAILLATADRIEALGARRREDARRVATWRLDAGGAPDPGLLLQAARVARFAHDFVQVARLATVLRTLDPSGESAALLGEAHYELGRFAESEEVLAAPVPDDTPEPVLVQRATLRAKNLMWGLCDFTAALDVVTDARAALSEAATVDLTAEEGAVLNFSGHPQAALDVLAPLTPDNPRTQVLRGITEAMALASVGRTTESVATAIETYRVHSELADPLGLAHPGTHIVNQAFALVEAGRFTEGEELAALGFDVAVNDNIPIAQIWFALTLGKAAAQCGRFREARRWYQEAASTARTHHFRGPLRIALAGLASSDAVLGDPAAAAVAVAEYGELPPYPFVGHEQALGPAWAAWAAGDPERARTILTAEAEAATATRNRGAAAWLWHDASRLGAKGIAPHLTALAESSDSASVAARAAHVRAAEAGDADGLAAAATTFEGLGMMLAAAEAASAAADRYRRAGQPRPATNLARRSQALAEHCPGVRTPGLVSADVAVPLTAREREIATLAAQGVSSQDIAQRLYVSVRTVNNHLQHAYTKLGVNRRDQLAEALGQ